MEIGGVQVKKIIIIPTYNERENISRLAARILTLGDNWEILIVDDNSPDGTGLIADNLSQETTSIHVLHRPGKLGLGPAYIMGMMYALERGYAVIGQMDADFSHPPELLPFLLDGLQTAHISLGSRYIPGGGVEENWPFWRKTLSSFGNWYARSILNLPLKDVTGGYRLWRREALITIPFHRIRSNGYSFLIEMLYVASRLGFRFHEVPFIFNDRHFGQSKMSFRIQSEAALRVWQIRFEFRDLHNEIIRVVQ